jgi:NTE family protein
LDGDRAVPEAARPARVGLALAGGGPQGAVYEIGALRALDEAIDGLDFNQLFIYVGVSAGAFIGACLANDLTTAQMCRALLKPEPGEHPFVPETFLTPDLSEFARSGAAVPALLAEGLWDYLRRWPKRSLVSSLSSLFQALPLGLFRNEPIRHYLERIYNLKGRTDDFRHLRKQLVIVATDLDSGQPVSFGTPGFDHVPISRAVEASSALPGLYRPVEIDGRFYVDGILNKTLHASVALEAGADVVLCVNPIVPLDSDAAVAHGVPVPSLTERGLPSILSQTLRTLIRSRLQVGISAYRRQFANSDVILIEPAADDDLMFSTNIFGFAERRAMCEHAYQTTRQYLRAHASDLGPTLARHGLLLRDDVLAEERSLWEQVGISKDEPDLASAPRRRGLEDLDRLESALGGLEALIEAQHSADRALAER